MYFSLAVFIAIAYFISFVHKTVLKKTSQFVEAHKDVCVIIQMNQYNNNNNAM